jgi:thiamine-phosphate pyrophosphorylase
MQVAAPRLIAITDLGVLEQAPLVAKLARLAESAQAGSVALLLRDHAASARARLALGEQLSKVAHAAGQQLWVADRLDLALLLDAQALHLGEQSVPAEVARKLVGERLRISRAFHGASLEGDGASAELVGVDALLVSPVLAPRKGRPALGLGALGVLGEQLRARNRACHLYALGGVTAANAAACLAAGAAGVAAIGTVLEHDVQPLLAALEILR